VPKQPFYKDNRDHGFTLNHELKLLDKAGRGYVAPNSRLS